MDDPADERTRYLGQTPMDSKVSDRIRGHLMHELINF